MFRRLLPVLLMALLIVPAAAFAGHTADDLVGFWYSDGDESIIHIEKVEGKYNGKIVWLKEPVYEKGDAEEGEPKRNREDRDKTRQKLPIIGLNMLEGFAFETDGEKWTGGTIYDPNVGKTYKCEIKFEAKEGKADEEHLYVRGYIGVPALGRTTYWNPVPEADLKKFELLPKDEAKE